MTTERSARPRGLAIWILVAALVLAAFWIGRLTGEPHGPGGVPPRSFTEDPAKRAVAEGSLLKAKEAGKLDDAHRLAFMRQLGPLAAATRRKLSLELVGLINRNKIILETPPGPPDPPRCPCGPQPGTNPPSAPAPSATPVPSAPPAGTRKAR